WLVVDDAGEIVAVGGALAYGSFCWIGLVATHPARQRQGLATKVSAQLIGWAHGLGCKTIALDASEAGRPVYERLGFRVVGKTAELSIPVFAGRKPSSVACLRREDVEQLLVLDRRIFGGDRARLFRALRQKDARCYVAKNGDEPVGYLFARKRLLGPGCARNDGIAGNLVRAALADRAPMSDTAEQRLLLPTESRYLDVLFRLGLRVERRLAHMRLGDLRLPGERDQLLAQFSYAAG
ncbi:MAG TPA: GNAT family N-acetyltransferase, partial [Gaiellaceae bacterium]|nr:GNAT family N-acetyltransferase [Gaiellaceae bacterium]